MRIVSPETGEEVLVEMDPQSRASNEFHILIKSLRGLPIGGRQFDDEKEAIRDGWWK
jgi:hypothetical protein